MTHGFPPQPVFPLAIDSDRTLFLVFNTAEARSRLTVDNQAWSDEIQIESSENEQWADNGFANIAGELFYYDAKTDDGDVVTLKRCTRSVAGEKSKFNKAGTWVRGYVIAEHHNQLVDAIINLENYIGVDGCQTDGSLDSGVCVLEEVPDSLDDHGCPDVEVGIDVVSPNTQCSGTVIQYTVTVNGNYTTLVVDFGDGQTSTTLTGAHTYAPNTTIDPIVTVANERCQIVASPSSRTTSTVPVPTTEPGPYEPVIPDIPTFPQIVIPLMDTPNIPLTLPQIVFPCLDIGSLGPISVPSIINIVPPLQLPSVIEFGPVTVPSIIGFGIVTIPPVISFGTVTIPPVISFGSCPIPPTISFDSIDFNTTISLGPLRVWGISIPSVTIQGGITIQACPPIFGGITIGQPSGSFGITILQPTGTLAVQIGTPPAMGVTILKPTNIMGITLVNPPGGFGSIPIQNITDWGSLSIGPMPAKGITIDPLPSGGITILSWTGAGSAITIGTLTLSGVTIQNIEDVGGVSLDWSNVPTGITVNWDGAPSVKISGTAPNLSCNIVINCQQGGALMAIEPTMDSFATEQPQTMTLDIPSEISVLVPKIPDIKILHNIPMRIHLEAPNIPDISLVAPDRVIPKHIEILNKSVPENIAIDALSLPSIIKLDTSSLPAAIELSIVGNLPKSILIDGSGIPQTIQAIGIPDVIELKGNIPAEIRIKVPENLTVPLIYKGGPIPIEFDAQSFPTSEDGQDLPCFAIVPCPKK